MFVDRYHELINKYIETDVLSSISSCNDFHCVSFLQDDGFGKAIRVDCMFVKYNNNNYGFEIAKEVVVASYKYRFTHSIVYEKLEDDTEEIIQNDINEFFDNIDEMINMGFVYFVCRYGQSQIGYKNFLTSSFYHYFASGLKYPDFKIHALKPIPKKWFYLLTDASDLKLHPLLNRSKMSFYFSDGFENSYSLLLNIKDLDKGFNKYLKFYEYLKEGDGNDFIFESYNYRNRCPVFLYNYLIACSYCNVQPKGNYKEHVVYKIAELTKQQDVSNLTVDYLLDLEKQLNLFVETSELLSEITLHHIIINKLFEVYNVLIKNEEKNIHEIWKIYMFALDAKRNYELIDDDSPSKINIMFLHNAACLFYKYRGVINEKYFRLLRAAGSKYFNDSDKGKSHGLNDIGFNTMITRACSGNGSLFHQDVLYGNYDDLINMLYRFHIATIQDDLVNQKLRSFNYNFAQCLIMLFYINGNYDAARYLSDELNIKPETISKLIDVAEGKVKFELVEIDGKIKNLYQNYYTKIMSDLTDSPVINSDYILENYPKLNHKPKFEIITEIADEHVAETNRNVRDVRPPAEGVIMSPSPYFV